MGFPWGLLGSSLTPCVPMIQGASIVGVYGLSALVVLINVLAYRSIWGPHRRRFIALLTVAVALPLGYGLVRIRPVEPWFRVGIVQPNVSPLDKGSHTSREEIWREMLGLSRTATAEGARVLLYPETAPLVDITRDGPFRDSLRKLSDSSGVMIVTGTPLYGSYGYANATTVFEPGKPLSQLYAKIHLAPFSEHFPFVEHLPFLSRIMTGDMGSCTPGRELKVFDAGGIRYSTPICFEGIFPEPVWRFVRNGAQAIMIVTNDGWFGKTPGPYQHCELMILRAVENGVPLVRAANNGISLVADPYGRVLVSTPLFQATELVHDVPRPLSGTLYRRTGDWFSYFSLVLVALLIVVRIARSSRIRKSSSPGVPPTP